MSVTIAMYIVIAFGLCVGDVLSRTNDVLFWTRESPTCEPVRRRWGPTPVE